MGEKPKVIVLCGSTKYCQQMAVVGWYLEKEEGAIVMGLHLLPWWYPDIHNIPDHLAEHEGVKEHCDNLHMRKIDLADEIFVVDVDCYTGNSTKREVEYAINKGLPIRYYSAEPMGLRVDGIYSAAIEKAAADYSEEMVNDFQGRVNPWLIECFGEKIARDEEERNHRFLEESLELVQACGCTWHEALQLVDYVYKRPIGEKHQEVGGVMVTLAALCLAQDLDMHENGETELARIWTLVEKIREKQAAKPKHSPLPV